jgi:hypothetical protein
MFARIMLLMEMVIAFSSLYRCTSQARTQKSARFITRTYDIEDRLAGETIGAGR